DQVDSCRNSPPRLISIEVPSLWFILASPHPSPNCSPIFIPLEIEMPPSAIEAYTAQLPVAVVDVEPMFTLIDVDKAIFYALTPPSQPITSASIPARAIRKRTPALITSSLGLAANVEEISQNQLALTTGLGLSGT
ncbi:hypothetical protein ACH5RR_025414, partial [Cinchona calisaya]